MGRATMRAPDQEGPPSLMTQYMLLAQYGGRVAIPVETVCRDFFSHLTVPKFLRKVGDGSIDLPVMRLESSAKAARAVHVKHLAAYLDRVAEAAEKEAKQINRAS